MQARFVFTFIIITIFMLAVDFYVWQGLRFLIQDTSQRVKQVFTYSYWGYTIFTFCFFAIMPMVDVRHSGMIFRIILSLIFAIFILKIIWFVFVLMDDIIRVGKATINSGNPTAIGDVSRSKFLQYMGLGLGGAFFGSMVFGITKGAHKYTFHRTKLAIKGLPKSWVGTKIVQISDIHSGSFYDKMAVQKGVDMINAEDPDIVFFTGDLVNDRATEILPFKEMFGSITSKHGVYSTLGNHDYGEYVKWPSAEAKAQNVADLIDHHKDMGWDILMDEHRVIEKNGEKLVIMGVQNWSAKRNFPRYGDLGKAYAGSPADTTKLLLSHDPSHWKEEITVNENYRDIAVTFSGHTHGMQFGIDSKWYRWSPVKLVYKEWIDLYNQDSQMLYVNRGFGYLGFPGRVGIWPEISVFTLEQA
jgi:uncharacterized protein